jgi:hypothetical protein
LIESALFYAFVNQAQTESTSYSKGLGERPRCVGVVVAIAGIKITGRIADRDDIRFSHLV